MEPLISIVTPCFNAETTIKATLISVSNQKKLDNIPIEHIVIDGASTDRTMEIVQQFSNLRWISEPDQGIADAFNKGLQLATGEYIMYLNADDYLYDHHVLYNVANFILSNQKPDWVVGDIVSELHGQISQLTRSYPPSCWSLMFRCRIGHPTVFLKRQCLLDVGGFDLKFKVAMDYDLWYRLCKNGINPTYFPRVISVFSKEGISSQRSSRVIEERSLVARKFRNTPLKKLLGYMYDTIKRRNVL